MSAAQLNLEQNLGLLSALMTCTHDLDAVCAFGLESSAIGRPKHAVFPARLPARGVRLGSVAGN